MRVAVLSLCRDRLDYTRHCFATLRENAGCDYTHYVLDQGSSDATPVWLDEAYDPVGGLWLLTENVGINRALNMMLDEVCDDRYDVVVKVDNDCELTEPDTLKRACEVAAHGNWIVSPVVRGLKNPPPILAETVAHGERLGVLSHVGGIFLAAPAVIYETFRHREDAPLWGSDDADVCHWFRERGGNVGYMLDVECNHYLTTAGQEADQPGYMARKLRENGVLA